jgi:hypothetical protein
MITPNILTAGDTLDFTTSVDGYPATAWILYYRLVPRDAQLPEIVIAANAEGDIYRVQVDAATTATWAPGVYASASYVEMGSERYSVGDRVEVTIRAGSNTLASGTDARSRARVALEAIDAVLMNRATIDQQQYSIAGRTLIRTPVRDLWLMRDRYLSMVIAERKAAIRAAGGADPSVLLARFDRRV